MMEPATYMGYTKSVRAISGSARCHLVVVNTGYERKALCGAMVEKWVTTYSIPAQPVKFAPHWEDKKDMCLHCLSKYNARSA